jgi:tetraacyldisaccharide 4'-kinase
MIIFLRILLFPFSVLYSLITFIRNFFYNTGIFKSHKVSKPVISIGNISTGGTGKSPFTLFLSKYYLDKNIKPAIISRGYKRKSKDIEIIFDGKNISLPYEKSGDEPLMMANSLFPLYSNFCIAVGSERVETSNFIIEKFNPDLVILDDAFQHRKIKRELDIVLIDANEMIKNKFPNSFILPTGNLRECFTNLSRADIIIQNNKFLNQPQIDKLNKFGKKVFTLNYSVKGFYNLDNIEFDIKGKSVCAFAGIAKPDSFFNIFKQYDCKLTDTIIFPDHYNYSIDDIPGITSKKSPNTIFITTEKDFVKIKHFEDFLKNFNVLFMKIELNLNKQEEFLKFLNNKIIF